jgi:hypothetical protein
MFLRAVVAAVGILACNTFAQTPGRRDLSYLDILPELHHRAPAEVARLEANLIRNPDDLSARARVLTYYFRHGVAQPRLHHILWVVKNRPESKLAGSPVVRITPESNALSTRSDYEAVRALWLMNIERHPGEAAVLANAAVFFEAEEPVRAADLFRRSWRLDGDNAFRRAALIGFYTRIVAACEPAKRTCPDPTWLAQVKSELAHLVK